MKKYVYALVDCNSFYASCERIFRPDLINKPVIVLSNNDGCVVALTTEAKALGIFRGDPFFTIRNLVKKHNVAYFSSNYELYADISSRIREVLLSFSPDVEVYSIDEAFLRIDYFSNLNSIAKEIQAIIKKWIHIPVSVGIGETKTLAKLANHIGKQFRKFGGCFNILNYPDREKIFKNIPIEKIWGIGYRFRKKLNSYGICTIFDLLQRDNYWIKKQLTIKGLLTVEELRGNRYIELEHIPPDKKTIVSSRQFGNPVTTKKALLEALAMHITIATKKLRKQGGMASVLGVFFATSRFKEKKHSVAETITLESPSSYPPSFQKLAAEIADIHFKNGYSYKNCGVILDGIIPENDLQYDLLIRRENRLHSLIHSIDSINEKYGQNCVFLCSRGTGFAFDWSMKRERLSPAYTTKITDIPVVK